jgi:N6-L-threonylcarbamoyladenine synthase
MNILGIESTAHTFGVGVVKDGEVLSNERDTYMPKQGGIIPYEAATHHYSLAPGLIKSALQKARVSLKDIDLFAFSQGPGLLPCLKAGFQITRFLSNKFGKKMVGVNHCIAHIEIARKSTKLPDPVMLYVSGGNTQVVTYSKGRYIIFGETQDIGIGNLIDKIGRRIGIPFPAGPRIEQLAKSGKNYIKLPYAIKGMDVSFSGMETAITRAIPNHRSEDLCFSLQETSFAMLIEASERAMAYCKKESLVITGGVAANDRLNEMGAIMCKERGAKFVRMDRSLSGDNGAMIAYTGYLMKDYKQKDLTPKPSYRTDTVEIKYR